MSNKTTPLAIVGISCLFPKADDLQAYWANIKNGVNAITGILSSGAVPPRITDTMLPGGRTGFASAADYRAAFEALRTPLYAVVSATKGDKHPDVKITHPQFGGFTWREWFLFMRVHDLDHMRQLQSNAAAFNA